MENPKKLGEFYSIKNYEHSLNVLDFIAGMTDEFAMEIHKTLYMPKKWSLKSFDD